MKRICLFIALVVILLNSADVYSQTTHAHASSRKWYGIDMQDIVDHIDSAAYLDEHYPNIKQVYIQKNGKWVPDPSCGIPIYLYNVGLDRFVIEGGDWGMEGRLFYEDFGRRMKLILEEDTFQNDAWMVRISPDITEQSTDDKCRFTCNVPGVTMGATWSAKDKSLTTIMDGYRRHGNWDFERVETDPESKFHTFRMSQQYVAPVNSTYDRYPVADMTFRLGAAYGEWKVPDSPKGNGYYVHIDDDRTCWTTAGNPNNTELSPWGNTTKVQVGSDMIEIDELYQWRIISEEEFITVLNDETLGLNPSISSLVPDRDFTRNSNEFQEWTKTSLVNENDKTDGLRYGYTFGYYQPGTIKDSNLNNKESNRFKSERWDKVIFLKQGFGDIKSAKYGYMSVEGRAKASVRFEIPRPGWYEIEYAAINFAPENHPAYFYALADGAMERSGAGASAHTATLGYQEMAIAQMDNISVLGASYSDIDFPTDPDIQNKGNVKLNLSVGKALTKHWDDFSHKFWIYIDPKYYNSEGVVGGKGLTLGIRKEHATKAEGGQNGNVSYYYDSDWVVLDNIKVSYMGLAPAFLYESQEDLDYLVFDEDKISERPGAAPDNKYSGSLSLARSMKTGQWNSFSMPIPLTGEQVRYAFGEDARLLELHSIGGLSENSNIIDFQSVELKPADPYQIAVEPGKFYLLKPTADPVYGLDAGGDAYYYYTLGRHFFTVNPKINDGKTKESEDYYKNYIMDPSVLSASVAIGSWNGVEAVSGGNNDGASYVSYVRTPSYSSFAVSNGLYSGVDAPDGTYATKGSYVISDGRVVEINKDTRLKGFRGWITLKNSLFTTDSEAKISINGVVDEDGATGIEATAIVPQRLADDTAVYDLGGRKVGTLGMPLPKGIYIVKGKKFMVN